MTGPSLPAPSPMKWLDEGPAGPRHHARPLLGCPGDQPGRNAPRPGFEDKVFYVWFDAPIEYIGATQEWAAANGEREDAWQALVADRQGRGGCHRIRPVHGQGQCRLPHGQLPRRRCIGSGEAVEDLSTG